MTSPFETLLDQRYADRREPTIPGVLTAIVTGRMDDGTYELRYLSMGGNSPSAPARVMAPTAGAGRGAWTMPEIGDEVVVAFDAGDTNNPIILGAVWNNQSPPPDAAEPSDENNIRTFVSRSGHQITFDDSPAGGKIKVRTEGGHELLLDDTAPGTVTLQSAGGAVVEISDADASITLRAANRVALEAPNIAFQATSSLSIQSPGGVSIQAPAGILLTTTGSTLASTLVIDGKPFAAHTHGVPPTTGPVTP